MRRSKSEAYRWLEQAKYDLRAAKRLFEQRDYSNTCFFAEQAGQKALKAYLYAAGERYVWEHSLFKLALKCRAYESAFEEVADYGKILDRYYLTTRYPDALAPPAVPYESFTEGDAQDALRYATCIVELVDQKVLEESTRR